MAAARRLLIAVALLVLLVLALYAMAYYTGVGQELVASLLIRPAEGGAGQAAAAPGVAETWFDWAYLDEARCYLDLDAGLERASADEGAVQVDCQPTLPSGIPAQLFTLQSRASNLGATELRRVPCPNESALPPCCLPDRAGLRATEEMRQLSGEPDARAATGLICRARYGCEDDPVYATGMVPWLPQLPLNCFAEENTNTCVHRMMERADPGTFSPNPAAVTEANRETLNFVCANDARTTAGQVVPGNEVPRMTPAELRAECLALGFTPQPNPGAGCAAPAGGAMGRMGRHDPARAVRRLVRVAGRAGGSSGRLQ
jgi:hypothetical protein